MLEFRVQPQLRVSGFLGRGLIGKRNTPESQRSRRAADSAAGLK